MLILSPSPCDTEMLQTLELLEHEYLHYLDQRRIAHNSLLRYSYTICLPLMPLPEAK